MRKSFAGIISERDRIEGRRFASSSQNYFKPSSKRQSFDLSSVSRGDYQGETSLFQRIVMNPIAEIQI